jgi:glycosyltransferase involved in cell wall biosynthesis
MRIAIITTCGFPWGGCEKLWTSAAELALSEGHEILISIFDWPQQHPVIRSLEASGAKLLLRRRFFPRLSVRIRKKIFNSFLSEGRKMTYHDAVLDFRPDHILFSLAGGDEIASDPADLMVFVRQLNVPFTVMHHSMTIGHVYPKTTRDLFGEVFASARHCLFTSRYQLELYREQTGDPILLGQVIAQPLPAINYNPPPDITGTIHFALIGSLITRWKGQDMVLSILSRSPWIERDWKLDIYGAGEDEYDLRSQVSSSVIRDRVIFHGHTQDIGVIYTRHHLVLIPSRQDTGPIVLFEAMLAGRPVVGTPMGAMPEFIEDGRTGILSSGIDEASFGEAMERAWESRLDWASWGITARERILKSYDLQPDRTLLDLLC